MDMPVSAAQLAEARSVFAVLIKEGCDTLPAWAAARATGARFFITKQEDGLPALVLRHDDSEVAKVSGGDLVLWTSRFASLPPELSYSILLAFPLAGPEAFSETLAVERQANGDWLIEPLADSGGRERHGHD